MRPTFLRREESLNCIAPLHSSRTWRDEMVVDMVWRPFWMQYHKSFKLVLLRTTFNLEYIHLPLTFLGRRPIRRRAHSTWNLSSNNDNLEERSNKLSQQNKRNAVTTAWQNIRQPAVAPVVGTLTLAMPLKSCPYTVRVSLSRQRVMGHHCRHTP